MTYPVQQITQSIQANPEAVYQFTSNPENLPKWASGLSRGIKKVGADWVAESPMGQVKVKFVERNDFGVLDHEVTLPNGMTMSNPLRVVKNHEGSEVVFTLFRQPEMSDQEFAKDAATIVADLKKLKSLLEKPQG